MEKRSKYIIAAIIALLTAVTFYLRIIPLIQIGDASPLALLAPDDPHYNLRLIELYVKTGSYQWFDPLSYFPYGLWLNWGPMFTVICAISCYLFGATTPEQIAYISMYVPPLMAALCVPFVYLIGKELNNWKTGIVAAVFMAFVGGQFFHRSVAGYLDHHTAEILFATIFVYCYIWALKHREDVLINTRNYLVPGLPVIVTWVSFFAFLYTMPTAILFAFGIFVFTIVWMYLKHDKNLALLNGMSFALVTATYLLLIPWTTAFNLDTYSIVHIAAYAAVAFIGFIFIWKDGKYWYYFVAAGIVILLLVSPVRDFIVSSMFQFFGQTKFTLTVQEARGWRLDEALAIFNIAIPLTFVGICTLLIAFWKHRKAEILFAISWVLLITISTIQHVRYEYYFAPVAAVCSAYALTILPEIVKPSSSTKDDTTLFKEEKESQKNRRQKRMEERAKKYPKGGKSVKTITASVLILVTILFTGIFVISSAPGLYAFSTQVRMGVTSEWIEPLVWMKNNTPDTGMDFDTVYKSEPVEYPKPMHVYPESAYGVTSWWDYGHIIEYYANRPVTANPFQAGVWGEYGAGNFFTTDNETEAYEIAQTLDAKYVITDIEMATGKFWAMATWANRTPSDYQTNVLLEGKQQTIFLEPFYETIITRLHMFDGSYRGTDHVVFIQHRGVPPTVTKIQIVNTSAEAQALVDASALPAFVAGDGPMSPTGEVPALKHFRLIHESPSDIGNGMRYVKVFEIVPGHVVPGEGIIATQITTNTGRQFWYGQRSENGVWTLPYPGTYMKENGEQVIVSEDDIHG